MGVQVWCVVWVCGCVGGKERMFFLCSPSVECWEVPKALPGPACGQAVGWKPGPLQGRLRATPGSPPELSTGPCTARW